MTLFKRFRKQKGFSLVEPLAAMVIAGAGLLALAKFQANLMDAGSSGRQRVEAMRLAQEKLEELRYVPYADDDMAAGSYNDTPDLANINTSFARAWTVTETADPGYKTVQVTVAWTDQKGVGRNVVLAGIITDYSLENSGYVIHQRFSGVATGSGIGGLRTPFNRGITIPIPAVDNLDGTSSYAPPGTSGVSLRFDNETGKISAITDNGVTTSLTGTDVGYLISGYISEDASSITLNNINLAMSITSGQAWNASTHGWVTSGTPTCWDDRNVISDSAAMNKDTERITLNGHGLSNNTGVQLGNLPGGSGLSTGTTYYVRFIDANTFELAATAGGAAIDLAKTGTISVYSAGAFEGYVTYNCVVKLGWRGSVNLAGFTLGTTSSTAKVCRYYATTASDTNEDGTADNVERPFLYRAAASNLGNQNYRVVAGNASCPTSPDTTVQHQNP